MKWDGGLVSRSNKRACLRFGFARIKHYRFPFVMWHDVDESKKRECRKFSSVFTVYSFLFSGIVVE